MALQQLAQENLTLNDTASGITSTTLENADGQPLNIIRAVFAYISGGNFYHSALQTPLDDGSDGSLPEFSSLSPKFIISGLADITSWQGIKFNGASDVELSVILEGVPAGGT